jgi:hypothetical protein
MFSSTHLVRKSKEIFDKLNNNEISKAIILRDGKPNFMLLDFQKYEKLMQEFSQLKELKAKPTNPKEIEPKEARVVPKQINSEEQELKKVLKEIENLDIDDTQKVSGEMKEFWN